MSRGSRKKGEDHDDDQFYQRLQEQKDGHLGEMVEDTK